MHQRGRASARNVVEQARAGANRGAFSGVALRRADAATDRGAGERASRRQPWNHDRNDQSHQCAFHGTSLSGCMFDLTLSY
jgi:hypothetical protein